MQSNIADKVHHSVAIAFRVWPSNQHNRQRLEGHPELLFQVPDSGRRVLEPELLVETPEVLGVGRGRNIAQAQWLGAQSEARSCHV